LTLINIHDLIFWDVERISYLDLAIIQKEHLESCAEHDHPILEKKQFDPNLTTFKILDNHWRKNLASNLQQGQAVSTFCRKISKVHQFKQKNWQVKTPDTHIHQQKHQQLNKIHFLHKILSEL